jgi:hypothetical protein
METPQKPAIQSLTEEEHKRLEEIKSKPVLLPPPYNVFSTRGAMLAIVDGKDAYFALNRHFRGDWGDVSPDDAAANSISIATKDRIISAYTASNGVKFWIITDDGHETTTILLPDEY